MPSYEHDSVVELFHNRPELVRELLRGRVGVELADGWAAETAAADLSQITPTEYRADHVTVFHRTPRSDGEPPALVVIVEVQLHIDPDKLFSWPAYVATAMARFRCPVRLLVVTPDPHVARWARRGIHHHGLSLEPIVVCLAELPPIVDPEAARKVPELAVLSAIAHPSLQAANVALEAIRALSSPQAEVYCDLILAALSVPVRQLLEAQMQDYEFQSGLAQRWLAKKSAELVAKAAEAAAKAADDARALGLEQGREQGQTQGLTRAAIELARSKLGSLDSEDEAALRQLNEPAQLTELIVNLGQASTPEAARAALRRAGKQQP